MICQRPTFSVLPDCELTLHDGHLVIIRPLTPDDRHLVRDGFRAMSPTSRYMRFFAITRDLDDEQLHDLTDIDQINHVAICAVAPDGASPEGYGVARFVRDPDRPDHAEFAIAVVDRMQRRGLGTLLMEALRRLARSHGVRELYSEVLAENRPVLAWLARAGASIHNTSHPAIRLIRWRVRIADDSTKPISSKAFVSSDQRQILRSTGGEFPPDG